MKKINKTKKASSQIGIIIMLMAGLLLLGSIFVDDGNQPSKNDYLNDRNYNKNNSYPEEDYLFYLNQTDIGRQKKITESFPNIEIGSKTENNIIHIGNDFKLKANPFSKTYYSFDLDFKKPQDVQQLLIYFKPERITGDQDLKILVNNQIYFQNKARTGEIPITINKKLASNQTKVTITFMLDKPKWYQIFNWNSFEVKELKVMEISQDSSNNEKEFNFQLDKDYLERVELNLLVDCEKPTTDNPSIKTTINGYIISDENPQCEKYINRITKKIPENILRTNKNTIKFETNGYYKLSYSINKIYFNDKDTYKFTINSFNDIIDVIMYGDFDKDVIDIKINEQTMAIGRDEIVSIIPYLKFGTNEIEFLTKPVEIKEFVVEKNEFLY
jgi:hypothetical protein